MLESAPYEIAAPRPGPMIQSLRAFGYDLPTAIADLVDNSISAGANCVEIDFHWDGDRSIIAVLDDGRAMTPQELTSAMRLGSRSPLENRLPSDLGRFGLGMKTASFSQCRRLTVASRPAQGQVAVRCWDLDLVTELDEWCLLDSASRALDPYLARLAAAPTGTVVLWEAMDRVTPQELVSGDDEGHRGFLDMMDQARRHLGMVFHRILASKTVKLRINGTEVKSWDPFMTGTSTVMTQQSIPFGTVRLEVSPYLLPHHSKLTREQYQAGAGPRGWTAQQGFYVYRNRRMLVGGDWLGLGGLQKEDHHKLCRIMLDIPNSLDAEWEIDVKKSRACPPPAIRGALRQIAVAARAQASRVYRHRGARLVGSSPQSVLLWEKRVRHGKVSYSLNRDHPFVADVLSEAGPAARKMRLLLALVEETVPVPTINIDASDDPTAQSKPFEHAPAALAAALHATFAALTGSGMTPAQAKVRLLNTEPFSYFPEHVTSLGDADFDWDQESI